MLKAYYDPPVAYSYLYLLYILLHIGLQIWDPFLIMWDPYSHLASGLPPLELRHSFWPGPWKL